MSSTGPSGPLDPVEALERLGRLAFREHCLKSLLQSVAELAKEVMPGDLEASVSLLINDRPSTAVFTGQLLPQLAFPLGEDPRFLLMIRQVVRHAA